MGWLTKLTEWLREQIIAALTALFRFFGDVFMIWLKHGMEAFVWLVNQIPVPPWLDQYSMCALLAQAGPEVGWFLGMFRIQEGLTLIGAGYAFRLTRKLFTAFQW